MSWIAVDTGLPNHPKMAALPSDTARWGWLVTLLEAKEQAKPGTFASERHYRHVVARHGRFLADYIRAGLMDRGPDGTLLIHDWQRHQWAAAKAKARETSEGQSEDISETSKGQKEDASRAVSVPVYVPVLETEGVQGEPDALGAFYTRTGEPPGPKMRRWLNDISASHGEGRLVAAMTSTGMGELNVSDYIRSLQDGLRLEDARAERAEKADEERRNAAKRAPIQALPPANDISEEEAKRQAAEYIAASRRSA